MNEPSIAHLSFCFFSTSPHPPSSHCRPPTLSQLHIPPSHYIPLSFLPYLLLLLPSTLFVIISPSPLRFSSPTHILCSRFCTMSVLFPPPSTVTPPPSSACESFDFNTASIAPPVISSPNLSAISDTSSDGGPPTPHASITKSPTPTNSPRKVRPPTNNDAHLILHDIPSQVCDLFANATPTPASDGVATSPRPSPPQYASTCSDILQYGFSYIVNHLALEEFAEKDNACGTAFKEIFTLYSRSMGHLNADEALKASTLYGFGPR